jgi:RNA polymerase sigma-70 factor (ECF subfamily)
MLMVRSNPPVPNDVREVSAGSSGIADRGADPDSDVLDLVAQRDMTGALRRLMQRHGTAVYRYCREALRDAALAEDVQQQVFIAAFRDLPRFSQRSSVRTWLFAIARHRALDAAKSRRRARSRVEGDDATSVPDPAPSPSDSLDDARLREALRLCLGELNPRVLSALLLRFQQGFTFEDMAAMCREKPGTLQAQVTRALPVLRTCIERRTGAVP